MRVSNAIESVSNDHDSTNFSEGEGGAVRVLTAKVREKTICVTQFGFVCGK